MFVEIRFGVYLVSLLAFAAVDGKPQPVRVGAFNIQVFGPTKWGKAEVQAHIIEIVSQYDIMLIQEIRNKDGSVIQGLWTALNDTAHGPYGLELSERLGRTTAKEQYAYFWRLDSGVAVLDTYQFDDGPDDPVDYTDWFEREPFCVLFELTHGQGKHEYTWQFATIGIHVKPDHAVAEIDHLYDVYQDVRAHWGTVTENVLIMGDLNADCAYASPTKLANVTLYTSPDFKWLIPDDADTTTSTTDCAYDRFVTTENELFLSMEYDAGVFHFEEDLDLTFDEMKAVSDHYPIEVYLLSPFA